MRAQAVGTITLMWIQCLALFLAAAFALSAQAVEPLKRLSVVLLQPGEVMEARGADSDALATYMKALESAAFDAVKAQPDQVPIGGFLVVALKPGERSNAWLDFRPEIKPALATRLVDSLKAVHPLPVKGVVVFSIKVSLWGGREPAAMAPAPLEWREGAKRLGERPEVSVLVEKLWPD